MTWKEAAEAFGVRVVNLDDPLHCVIYAANAKEALWYATEIKNWMRFRIEVDGALHND